MKSKRSSTSASRANAKRGSTDHSKPSYPPVESIQRALSVLRVVNSLRIATVNEINEATRYPKSSIVRVLETLVAEGYVARDNLCGGYRVTSRSTELCAGYHGLSSLIECARPHAVALTNRIKWPVNIGLLVDDVLVTQFSTAPISPIADVPMLGQRHALLSSAVGRAYLAFCNDDERERLVARAVASEAIAAAADEWRLRTILPMIRNEGFALGAAASLDSTIALPIFRANDVAAVISLDYYDSAMPRAAIRDQLITPLSQTARRIEKDLSEAGNAQPSAQREKHVAAARPSAGNRRQFGAPARPPRELPSYDDRLDVTAIGIAAE